MPLRIGLVTSIGSAAWHDVVDELLRAAVTAFASRRATRACRVNGRRRWSPQPSAPWLVTGSTWSWWSGAAGRGSDLAAFDTDAVARAVATCPVPVVTGLGHELDKSVADEVAHLALKTPTACATLLAGRVTAYRQRMESAWTVIAQRAGTVLNDEAEQLSGRADHAARRTARSLDVAMANVSRQAARLARGGRRSVWSATSELERAAGRARADGRRHLVVAANAVEHRAERVIRRARSCSVRTGGSSTVSRPCVRALDPARALARGWSITRDANGQVIRSVADVGDGDDAHHDPRRRAGAQPGRGDSPAMSAADDRPDVDQLGYADALAELDGILTELEGDAVDVDRLGERVRRAAALIRLCRGRIDAAKLEIDQVVAELDQEA